MRSYTGTAYNCLAYAVEFGSWNFGWLAPVGDEGVYPRSGDDIQPTPKISSEKYVAGKQWQTQQLNPVLPIARSCIEWKKDFKSLAGKISRYRLLMLMFCV